MNFADRIPKLHDKMFGEGSWDKMEAEVKARHPELSWIWEEEEEDEPEEQPRKWWQFWR